MALPAEKLPTLGAARAEIQSAKRTSKGFDHVGWVIVAFAIGFAILVAARLRNPEDIFRPSPVAEDDPVVAALDAAPADDEDATAAEAAQVKRGASSPSEDWKAAKRSLVRH